MNYRNVYVIRDGKGNYISPRKSSIETEESWFFVAYTGSTTGFTFYTNIDTAKDRLNKLYDWGHNDLYLDYIDLKSIPKGRRI